MPNIIGFPAQVSGSSLYVYMQEVALGMYVLLAHLVKAGESATIMDQPYNFTQ